MLPMLRYVAAGAFHVSLSRRCVSLLPAFNLVKSHM